MDDHVLVKGTVKVLKNSKVVYEGNNLVVNMGLGLIASLLADDAAAPSHIAMGSGSTPVDAADEELDTELHREALTATVAGNAVTFVADFTGDNSGDETVQEFGIFNDPTAGDMLARFLCPSFTWGVDESLVVSWTINIGELG